MSGSARSSQGYWDHLAEILTIPFSYGYVRSAVGLMVWGTMAGGILGSLYIRKFCEVNVPKFVTCKNAAKIGDGTKL